MMTNRIFLHLQAKHYRLFKCSNNVKTYAGQVFLAIRIEITRTKDKTAARTKVMAILKFLPPIAFSVAITSPFLPSNELTSKLLSMLNLSTSPFLNSFPSRRP